MFEGVAPIFRVSNLERSLEHYVHVLGFQIDWEGPVFASVSRDRCHIFLSEGDQGHPGAWVWVGVSDVEALFAEYSAAAAKIRNPPTNYPWAREMQVEDPDGNILRLGSEPREGEPCGEWLDMKGQRWKPLPGGRWTRA